MQRNRLFALTIAAVMVLSTACAAQAADDVVDIVLSDSGITVEGKTASTDSADRVYTGNDIIYYKDGTDVSYGEGTEAEMHSAEEAEAHTVVTITQPGTYRLTGTLSAGQIFVDLGEDAKRDPEAVVTLILDNVDITCTVAPAVFFYNVYECDEAWVAYDEGESEDFTASAIVDTANAGVNVVIAAGSVNTVTGSHVARIYKEGTTKKLHKYDGAFYSRMSMNIDGENGDNSGELTIIADNEGLDSELHLTINGGTLHIESQDDGINTNEDYVSVTTINGGNLTIAGGLGSEGDGIDSNGYLVINGGTIWTTANPQTGDGGIDADSPILINGGNVYAFGSRNDAADSDSEQVYMEFSFASTLPAGSEILVTDAEGNQKMAFTLDRACQSMTLSLDEVSGPLELDTVYHIYVDGVLQCYSGNSFGMMGGPGGRRPDDGGRPGGGERPELPEGETPPMTGEEAPAPFDGEREFPGRPDGGDGQRPEGGLDDMDGFSGGQADGSGSTDFVLTVDTKSFSGVCDSDASGKTRVSFTVEGVIRTGRVSTISAITAITASEEIDPSLVQITITDDPSEDYAVTCLLSDGLDAANALLPTADGNYILTVAVAAGSDSYTGATQLSFSVGALPFVDVNGEDDCYEAVKVIYAAGAMVGTGDSRFSPEDPVTRAQAITVLARLMGAEAAENDSFSDVTAGSWYAGYVGWAVDSGIVEGDGEGRFLPDEPVTAEQMALMLGRLEESYTNSTSFAGALTRGELAQMLLDVMG